MEISSLEQRKRKFAKLKSERSTWESHWQELLDNNMPKRGSIQGFNTPGSKRQASLLDNTSMHACEMLAAALHGMLTNPFSQWFELTTGNDELDADDDVRKWLQDVTRQVHVLLNQSNFQTEIHELYLDLSCIGTAPMLIEEDEKTIFRFSTKNIKNTYICENAQGVIDEIFQTFSWDARTIVEKFGKKALSKKMKDSYESGTSDTFLITHNVYPKDRYDTEDYPKESPHQYISCYEFFEEDHVLEKKGFFEFPYVVPRWTKTSDETYGRSPAMVALPEAKMVNKMMETVIKGAQKVVDPPLQCPDDGFIMPIKLVPGGMNFYRNGGQDRIEPLFKHDLRIDFGFQAVEQIRDRIRKAFYVDQLQMPTNGPMKTATEVNKIAEEQLRFLGPMLGRQQTELLEPTITRIFGIMGRRGLLPPMPRSLQNTDGLTVRYSSLIAKAQRVSESDSILRTLQAVAPFMQMDPNVVDNFSGDNAVLELARIHGFPQSLIRDKDEIQKIRAAKAEANRQLVEQQNQTHSAEMVSKVSPALKQAQ